MNATVAIAHCKKHYQQIFLDPREMAYFLLGPDVVLKKLILITFLEKIHCKIITGRNCSLTMVTHAIENVCKIQTVIKAFSSPK